MEDHQQPDKLSVSYFVTELLITKFNRKFSFLDCGRYQINRAFALRSPENRLTPTIFTNIQIVQINVDESL